MKKKELMNASMNYKIILIIDYTSIYITNLSKEFIDVNDFNLLFLDYCDF
jgi:hypothetical protein